MTEIDKKRMKKLITWQQEALDSVVGYEWLINELKTQRYFTEPLKKIMAERQKHAELLQAVTGKELKGTQGDAKTIKRTLHFFSLRRVLSVLSATMQEAGRSHEFLMKYDPIPSLKVIIAEEKRQADTLKRLEKQAKKNQDIAKKIKKDDK